MVTSARRRPCCCCPALFRVVDAVPACWMKLRTFAASCAERGAATAAAAVALACCCETSESAGTTPATGCSQLKSCGAACAGIRFLQGVSA